MFKYSSKFMTNQPILIEYKLLTSSMVYNRMCTLKQIGTSELVLLTRHHHKESALMMSENCTITPIPPPTADSPNLSLGGFAGEAEGAASSWLQGEQVFNEYVYSNLCRNTIDAADLLQTTRQLS
jgi:hypothetical protein